MLPIYICVCLLQNFWLISPINDYSLSSPCPCPLSLSLLSTKLPRIPPPALLNGSAHTIHQQLTQYPTHMAKLPPFFARRAVAPPVRVPSPSHRYKNTQSFLHLHNKTPTEFSSKSSSEISFNEDAAVSKLQQGHQHSNLLQSAAESNRVMLVVDSTPEAMAALQWALSHTVQTQDTIILLHISKPSKLHRGKLMIINYCYFI